MRESVRMRHSSAGRHVAFSLFSALLIGVVGGILVALAFGVVVLLRQPQPPGDIMDGSLILLYAGAWFGGMYGLTIGLVLTLTTLLLRSRPHVIREWRLGWSIVAAVIALMLSLGLFTAEELASEVLFFLLLPVVAAGTLAWILIPGLVTKEGQD